MVLNEAARAVLERLVIGRYVRGDGGRVYVDTVSRIEALVLQGHREILMTPSIHGEDGSIRIVNPALRIDGRGVGVEYLVLVATLIRDELMGMGVEHYWIVGPESVELLVPPCTSLAKGIDVLRYAVAFTEVLMSRLRIRLLKASYAARGRVSVSNVTGSEEVLHVPYASRGSGGMWVIVEGEALDSFERRWLEEPYVPRSVSPARDRCSGIDSEALKLGGSLRSSQGSTVSSSAKRAPRLGRFQVMALLQAARYYVLSGDLAKAKSFGLNRAIFYAWAKNRGYLASAYRGRVSPGGQRAKGAVVKEGLIVSPRGWFAMGDEEQRPEDYDATVARRIEELLPYDIAWRAALRYVSSFDRETLRDPQRFYKEVYEPVRDSFIESVVLRGGAVVQSGASAAPRLGRRGLGRVAHRGVPTVDARRGRSLDEFFKSGG